MVQLQAKAQEKSWGKERRNTFSNVQSNFFKDVAVWQHCVKEFFLLQNSKILKEQ